MILSSKKRFRDINAPRALGTTTPEGQAIPHSPFRFPIRFMLHFTDQLAAAVFGQIVELAKSA